jgi:hypothetical protein
MAMLTNSSGTRSMKFCCPFRKDSQRGWFSSMIDTSTRSIMGRRRPLKRQQGLAFGIVGGRLGVVIALAVLGVALQRDQRAAAPLHQLERTRAHRVGGDLRTVGLDHLAGDGAVEVAAGQQLDQAGPGLGHLQAQGVAVQRAQAGHHPVVVEGLAALERFLAQGRQTDEVGLFQVAPGRALVGRVGEALEGIDVVLGHQLALAALEGRI